MCDSLSNYNVTCSRTGYNREQIEFFSMKLMCWKRENGEQYDNINFDQCQIVVAGQQAVSSDTRGELLQQELL